MEERLPMKRLPCFAALFLCLLRVTAFGQLATIGTVLYQMSESFEIVAVDNESKVPQHKSVLS